MTKAKEWTWELVDDDIWEQPSEDVYYYAERWKQKGFKSVLDLGCGIGRHTLLFAQRGFEVSGLDLSSFGVEKTGQRLRQHGLTAELRVGDIHELPYADNSFDALLAYHVISHTDSIGIRKILAELRRVVKPGGELFFTLCSKDSPSYSQGRFERIDGNTIMKVDGPEQHIPHFYSDESELPALLSGFSLVKLRHIKDVFGDTYGWHFFLLCGNRKEVG